MPRTPPGFKNPPSYGQPKKKKTPPAPVHSEISTGLGPPPKRGQGGRPNPAPEIQQGLPKEVTGPPIPALQTFGYFGSIHDVNQRVQDITDAYNERFGHDPTPGLVFDALRGPTDDFHALFGVLPTSSAQAQAHQALGTLPGGPKAKLPKPGQELADGLGDAVRAGTLDTYEREHHEELKDALKDPQSAGLIARAFQSGQKDYLQRKHQRIAYELDQATRAGDQKEAARLRREEIANLKEIDQMGFGPQEIGGALGGILETTVRGVTQVASSLRHSPGGLYQLTHAAVLDERDMLAGKAPTRTPVIGKAIAKQYKEDVEHPNENAGFLFLDILGLAGGGSGAVTRVARAGKAARAGEGLGSVARNLASRPVGGTYELRVGDHVEHELQSENRAVALVQRQLAGRRNAKMELRRNRGEPYPAGAMSVVLPAAAEQLLDQAMKPFRTYLSSEAKVGRIAATRGRIEHTVAMDLARRLDHVSGWSVNSARIFSRMPRVARKGLTRGEQKAIQVLSVDDPNPLQAMRDFHQYAIDAEIGSAKSHRRQLADLALAEKALANPSKRFTKALDLTRQVIAEQERLKVDELGLSPLVAEERVARVGKVVRGEEALHPEKVSAESFYLPFVSKRHSRGRPSERFGQFGARPGPYGVPAPGTLPELNHFFTGNSIDAGDFRIDATHLATEAYARTVKAVTVRSLHKDLWENAAVDTRPGGWQRQFYVPIRDVKAVPGRLKEILSKVDEGEFTAKDAAGLAPEHQKVLLEALFPDEARLTPEEISGVKWVDTRLLGDTSRVPPLPTGGKRVLQTINEPLRDITLYLAPRYILNAVGNTALGLIHQGPLLPVNVARAVFKKGLFSERAQGTISALVGEGKSKSYTGGDVTSFVNLGSQKLARGWSFIADKAFREAAFIHEARRQGFKTSEQMDDLLFNKAHEKALVEVTRRANKSMVEFDNLTWFEKNTLRHFIFVYPWVSRSAVWSIRTLIEHPIQANIYTQLGHLEEDDMEKNPAFAHAPEWFKRTGYIPIGWDKDGKPKVVNPTSINSFATIGDLLDVAKAGIQGDAYSNFGDMFGPGANFLVHAALGRDEFGNEYPGSQWWGAAREVLTQLPQVTAYEKKSKAEAGQKPPPIDIRNRRTLVERRNKMLQQTVFSPGFWDGYGSLIAGGLTPRVFDPDSAASRFWENQDMATRHKNELKLVNEALGMQAKFLGRSIPKDVKAAVTFGQKRTWAYQQWSRDHAGRTANDVDKTHIDIQLLVKERRLNPDDAQTLSKRLGEMKTDEEISRFRRHLNKEYGGAKALGEWDADVRFVYSFRPEILQAKLDGLHKTGLIVKKTVPRDQKVLHQYGLQALEYQKRLKKLVDESKDPTLTEAEASLKMQDIRNFTDQHDHPIRVGDHTFPSAPRLAYANMTAQQRVDTIATAATTSWGKLSALDKELLGKKVSKDLGIGWKTLAYYKALITGKIQEKGYKTPPVDQRSVGKDYEIKLAKYVEKYGNDGKPVPGFFKDYLFSKQPLYYRLSTFSPIQKSPNRKAWEEVFSVAAAMNKYKGRTTQTALNNTWKDYVQSTVLPYIETNKPFYNELKNYGSSPQDFLNGLIN